ncbi:MAG: LysR family transcriptional regulator [Sphingobium sp.]
MQLRTLRYFLTLASEQHFARAADRCGVTQPTLSAALSALEEELGKRLVERDRRYVGLTPEGRAMLPWAQQMLAAHEGMLQSVEALGGPIHGEFRLGTIPAAMPAAGRLARALLASHPGISLSVRSFTSREIVRGLKAFELDAGLTYLDHEPPSDMFSVALYEERYMFVACDGAGFDGRDSISWEDAAAAPLCLLHQGMQNRRILDARLAALGLAITPRATSDSYVVLLALVRSGGFATIMPDSYAGMVEGLRWARTLRLEGDHSASRIGLIVADRAPMPPLAAAALAAAREVHRTGV